MAFTGVHVVGVYKEASCSLSSHTESNTEFSDSQLPGNLGLTTVLVMLKKGSEDMAPAPSTYASKPRLEHEFTLPLVTGTANCTTPMLPEACHKHDPGSCLQYSVSQSPHREWLTATTFPHTVQ